MKSVMISIKPRYCELIAIGKKTVEVRKARPKLETPFKCYIYCAQSELLTRSHYSGKIYVAISKKHQKALERNGNITLSGKVIGEFVCDYIYENMSYDCEDSCVSVSELQKYANSKPLYGWHISDLIIYNKPKDLIKFDLSRPPQSWRYVEMGVQ